MMPGSTTKTAVPSTTKEGDFRRALAVLVCLGSLLVLLKAVSAARIEDWWGSDSAIYIDVAKNLVNGRGFVVDHVAWLYLKHPQIVHPDETGNPLYPVFVALSYLAGWKGYFGAIVPNILISSLALPLLTLFLGRELGLRQRGALFAAVTVALHPRLFDASLYALNDLTVALCVTAALLFYLRTDRGRLFDVLLLGVSLGAAALAKNIGFLLIPVLCVAHWLRRRDLPEGAWRSLALAVLVAVLVTAPWALATYRWWGQPFYSVHFSLASLPPGVSGEWVNWDRPAASILQHYVGTSWRQWLPLEVYDLAHGFYLTLVGVERSSYLEFQPRLLLGVYNLLWSGAALWAIWLRRRDWRFLTPALFGTVYLVVVPLTYYVVGTRILLFLFPLVVLYAWWALERAPSQLAAGSLGWPSLSTASAVLFMSLVVAAYFDVRVGLLNPDRFQPAPDRRDIVAAAKWARQGLPEGSAILTPYSPVVHYYSGRPTVIVPKKPGRGFTDSDLEDFLEVVRHYPVTYAFSMPGLVVELATRRFPGVFHEVKRVGTITVFSIKREKLQADGGGT